MGSEAQSTTMGSIGWTSCKGSSRNGLRPVVGIDMPCLKRLSNIQHKGAHMSNMQVKFNSDRLILVEGDQVFMDWVAKTYDVQLGNLMGFLFNEDNTEVISSVQSDGGWDCQTKVITDPDLRIQAAEAAYGAQPNGTSPLNRTGIHLRAFSSSTDQGMGVKEGVMWGAKLGLSPSNRHVYWRYFINLNK